jgi:prevent-host-death family protein
MKSVSAMELRRNLGQILDEVRIREEPVVIERAGKPIAVLGPIPHQDLEREKTRRIRLVHEAAEKYGPTDRGRDPIGWIRKQREDRT